MSWRWLHSGLMPWKFVQKALWSSTRYALYSNIIIHSLLQTAIFLIINQKMFAQYAPQTSGTWPAHWTNALEICSQPCGFLPGKRLFIYYISRFWDIFWPTYKLSKHDLCSTDSKKEHFLTRRQLKLSCIANIPVDSGCLLRHLHPFTEFLNNHRLDVISHEIWHFGLMNFGQLIYYCFF